MSSPKIVVLDGYTLNSGDLSWEPLKQLGDTQVYDRTAPDEVIERAKEAEIILTNKVVLDAPVLRALPGLRYVGVLATGYNVVDCEVARQRGVRVANVPAYSTYSVAQLVFALLGELAFRVGHHSRRVREGAWSQSADFTFRDASLVELEGRVLGVVGFGRIGSKVAEIGVAMGMNVMVATRTPSPAATAPVDFVSLDLLFQRSDVVSLHCPLTPQTEGLVNADRIARMKQDAYLINTARGPLIDELALAEALREGRIAGAGLDVLCSEPPTLDNPLLTAPRCVITPHIGWGTQAARGRLMHEAVENVRAFLDGRERNVVG